MACVTISRAIVVLPLPGAPLRMRQSFRPSNTALSILSSSDRPHDVILLHSLSRVQFGNSSKVDIDLYAIVAVYLYAKVDLNGTGFSNITARKPPIVVIV